MTAPEKPAGPVIREMPPAKPALTPLEDEIAWMLVRIENNYRAEGTGWGSRFEGERLEVVQARAVIRCCRPEWTAAEESASFVADDARAVRKADR